VAGRSTGNQHNRDVWYAYTPQTDGPVTVAGCDSPYSYYLSVHSACPGTGANEIGCALYGCSTDYIWPEVSFDGVAGETYLIRVAGFNGVEIDYSLTVIGPDCSAGSCAGDANGDGTVNPLDTGFVMARLGCAVGAGDADCDLADQNGDGEVDPLEVGFVLARFGECD